MRQHQPELYIVDIAFSVCKCSACWSVAWWTTYCNLLTYVTL